MWLWSQTRLGRTSWFYFNQMKEIENDNKWIKFKKKSDQDNLGYSVKPVTQIIRLEKPNRKNKENYRAYFFKKISTPINFLNLISKSLDPKHHV